MEALLFTGFGLAIFCLGVATGAIIENKLIRVRSEIYEEHAQIAEEVKKNRAYAHFTCRATRA